MGGENEQKPTFNGWPVVQGVISSVVAAIILSLIFMVSGLRDSARDGSALNSKQGDEITANRKESIGRDEKLETAIKALADAFYEFESDGARYSEDDGNRDRKASRERSQRSHERDKRIERELDKLAEKVAVYRTESLKHAAIPEHPGAKYRLKSLEDHFGGLRILELNEIGE